MLLLELAAARIKGRRDRRPLAFKFCFKGILLSSHYTLAEDYPITKQPFRCEEGMASGPQRRRRGEIQSALKTSQPVSAAGASTVVCLGSFCVCQVNST